MRNKGVTLISLVVTIVVLLILSGITIGTVFNDNGIIKKAQEAANATEGAIKNEQTEINGLLSEMNSIINGSGGGTGGTGGETIPEVGTINGKIAWSTGSATLTLTTDVEGVTIQYRKNSDNNWTNYTSALPSLLHGDKVYAIGVKNGATVINEKEFKILDTTAPTVTIANTSSTTNSISATATATDNEAGMGSNPQYTFYIKKTAEADSAYTQIGNGASASITKNDLEQNISYTIKVEVADVAGNKGQATKEITTGKIADAGEGLANGAIIASSPVWSNGTASMTLSTSSGLTIQYQKNVVGGSWTTGTNVTGLRHRDTVFARLTDGRNYGGEASITILDGKPPTVGLTLGTVTENSIQVTVNATDLESGLASTNTYKYYANGSLKHTGTETSYTIVGLSAGTNYTIKVEAYDKAGNVGEDSKQKTTEIGGLPETKSYVGYYADVDDNGSVDGIIYADLAIGGSGYWGTTGNGSYTIPKESNFKKYEISKSGYLDDFGTKDVISVTKKNGNHRFYVMALDDVDSNSHAWYAGAEGKITNFSTIASTSFGQGVGNTIRLINAWKNGDYGPGNQSSFTDMWGLSSVKVGIESDPVWFVPSIQEMSAFLDKMEITTLNYFKKGLSDEYGSSSLWTSDYMYYVSLYEGKYHHRGLGSTFKVRLSCSF